MGRLPRQGRAETTTDASPAAVYRLVSDVTRVGEWSHECYGAEWADGATTAVPGARFRGRNTTGRSRWTRVNEVLVADAPHEFAFRTVSSMLYPDSTIWRFTIEPRGAGAHVVQTFEVVKINPLAERLFYLLVPQHRDRSAALASDLARLGEVAMGNAVTLPKVAPATR
jgi:hypothetical protein